MDSTGKSYRGIVVPGTLNVRLPQPFDGLLPWYFTDEGVRLLELAVEGRDIDTDLPQTV